MLIEVSGVPNDNVAVALFVYATFDGTGRKSIKVVEQRARTIRIKISGGNDDDLTLIKELGHSVTIVPSS